jgi:hypothetical protein
VIRACRLFGLLALVLLLSAASASASKTQESTFQDNRLLLGDPAQLPQTLETLKRLGVSRLRISVLWDRLAPSVDSRRPPQGFQGTDPASYLAAAWAPYDAIAADAAKFGIGLNFNLTGAAPLWATRRTPSANLAHVWYPSGPAFGAFAAAVGRRYSGHYTPPGSATALPRVDYWSIWNEPNVGTSSLSPQTVQGIEVGPRLYRSLVDAAYGALRSTGHGGDTILVGELASTGHADPGSSLGMQPLRFLRALFCVDSGYRPLRASAASARGCPSTAAASRGFRAAHPALFDETGWSHHPYHLTTAPGVKSPDTEPDWVTLADLPKLETALDRLQRLYGSPRRLPIYLTEYGFETNPPRPEFAISPAAQASYLNQAEYLAWRDPRVRTFSQYLLEDAPPGGGSSISSFASGLMFANGTAKPAFNAYRVAIWLPAASVHAGQTLEIWGCVRPAARYPRHRRGVVRIELSGRTLRTVALDNPRGYFDVRVRFERGGAVRLAWREPGGGTLYSSQIKVVAPSGNSLPVSSILIAVVLAMLLAVGARLVWRRAAPIRPS